MKFGQCQKPFMATLTDGRLHVYQPSLQRHRVLSSVKLIEPVSCGFAADALLLNCAVFKHMASPTEI